MKFYQHQDGNIGPVWPHFPSREDQLTAIHRQGIILKTLKHMNEAEAPPRIPEAKKDCIRR